MSQQTPQIITHSTLKKPNVSTVDKLIPGLLKFDNLYQSNNAAKQSKVGAVPIYSDRVNQLQRQANIRSLQNNQSSGNANDEDETMEDVQKTKEYELVRFAELKKFKPNGLKDQLFEIVLTKVKLRGSIIVEQVLNEIVGEEGKDSYSWTFIDDSNNEDMKIVFIRFNNEDSLKNIAQIRKFQQLSKEGLEINGSQWVVNLESNTEALVNEGKKVDSKVNKEVLMEKINEVLKNNINSSNIRSDDNLDYQVDENELLDLPVESLPQLRKDIKEFRLKVIENEKKKREREATEEMKRSKGQLRKLFEKFKNEANEIVEDDDEESDSDEEDDGLTDEQFEAQRIEKENNEILRKYNEKVKQVSIEERHNKELIEELEDLLNYESSLDKTVHKDLFIQGKFKPSNRDKLLEEEQDELDRQQASKEKEIAAQSRDFLNSINIPLKVNMGNQDIVIEGTDTTNKESSTKEDGNKNSIESLSEDKLDEILEKLKPKVESLIEEFLGVKEDELLEYILMIIKENKTKSALVEELKETFDEDAVKMGDKVWNELEKEI